MNPSDIPAREPRVLEHQGPMVHRTIDEPGRIDPAAGPDDPLHRAVTGLERRIR